jgi:hypothetical protein
MGRFDKRMLRQNKHFSVQFITFRLLINNMAFPNITQNLQVEQHEYLKVR